LNNDDNLFHGLIKSRKWKSENERKRKKEPNRMGKAPKSTNVMGKQQDEIISK